MNELDRRGASAGVACWRLDLSTNSVVVEALPGGVAEAFDLARAVQRSVGLDSTRTGAGAGVRVVARRLRHRRALPA